MIPGGIFNLLSQRVFPAVKNFKNGKLPVITAIRIRIFQNWLSKSVLRRLNDVRPY